MRKLVAFLALAALVSGGFPASAQQQQFRERPTARGDQAMAREEMRAGRTMSSREIERRIIPTMPGNDYLGFEYDADASAYRLKFMREGKVTWVDVDARNGRVLNVARPR